MIAINPKILDVLKILSEAEKDSNSIILYSIVDSNLAKYLANTSNEKK